MKGDVTCILTFDQLPELDRNGRPKMFYGQRIHDKCYRRAFFDAGQYVEACDDDGVRKGWCLYKMGCRGPSTYNACSSMKWNNGVSFPIGSGHPCIGSSEENFWDNGPFYHRLSSVPAPGIDSTLDTVGKTLVALTGIGVAAHLVSYWIRRALILLDAVALGAPPGAVHVLQGDAIAAHHAVTAHGSNALELLAAAGLLGDLPPSVTIIGIEPASIRTGIGLSPAVEAAIPEALSRARTVLASAIQEVANDHRS